MKKTVLAIIGLILLPTLISAYPWELGLTVIDGRGRPISAFISLYRVGVNSYIRRGESNSYWYGYSVNPKVNFVADASGPFDTNSWPVYDFYGKRLWLRIGNDWAEVIFPSKWDVQIEYKKGPHGGHFTVKRGNAKIWTQGSGWPPDDERWYTH